MTAPPIVVPRVLRDYQNDAVNAVLDAWADNEHRVGVVLPTGSGKSTIIAAVARAAAGLGLRVVILAHRGELLDQIAAAVAAVDPEFPPVGIVRGKYDDHSAIIVAATLQTLVSGHRRERIGVREVILWDEVHHAGADSYREVLSELGGFDDAYFCGFTATMRREDNKGLGAVISRVVYERDLRWAVRSGFLVQPSGLTVKIPDLDLASVKTVAGDFQNNELAEVMEAATDSVVDAIQRFAGDRRPIVFAAGVDAAHALAAALSAADIPAEAVDGSMTVEEREPVYERYRYGYTQALVTVQILTEGADFPMCDAAVIARPTKSQVLYSQMVGRALRLYPGKVDALVLDLTGTARVLSLVTLSDLSPDAPVKVVDPDGNELEPEYEIDDDPIEPPERTIRRGPVDMIEIDLLASSSTGVLWLQTVPKDGVPIPFMPLQSDLVVFLWPLVDLSQPYTGERSAQLYRSGYMNMRGAKKGEYIGADFVDVATASAEAEDWLVDAGYKLPLRRASWRRDQPPSDKQLNMARMLGIPDSEGMTKARLSDEISIKLTTSRFGR